MKQIIVRVRDSKSKTIKKAYYYSLAHYKDEILDFVSDLTEGQEVYIKIGNLYGYFVSYEEIIDDMSIDKCDFHEELYSKFLDNYSLNYYLKEYLPTY